VQLPVLLHWLRQPAPQLFRLKVTESFSSGPFRPQDPRRLSLLREHFQAVGFTEEGVGAVLQYKSDRNIDTAYVARRTLEPTPFHSLIRLFILGLDVSFDTVVAALSPAGMDCALASGLVHEVTDGVRATACLRPWGPFFLLSDFLPPEGEQLRPDFVMSGTSASSKLLARLTIRRRVARALDIGTGAGIHALLAAAHAGHVVATDINKRALNFAVMNARLNRIENISFVEGSFFEPLLDQKFDLIVSNPPFVISPPSGLMFQNAELDGQDISELILRGAARHLREGGFAVSLISWAHETEEDWSNPPAGWAAGTNCDLWLLCAANEDPLAYAAYSLRQTENIQSRRYAELLDRWLAFYRERGFVRLNLGAAILRKRVSGKNWVHCENLSGAAINTDASDQIERVFAAEDLLEKLIDDDALLDIRVNLHQDHALDQILIPTKHEWTSNSLVLRSTSGIEHHAGIDARTFLFLSLCDGNRTVGEIIAEVAQKDGTDLPTLTPVALPLVRRLLRHGFITAEPASERLNR
jgi:methylase of polypeptide subunit release factors